MCGEFNQRSQRIKLSRFGVHESSFEDVDGLREESGARPSPEGGGEMSYFVVLEISWEDERDEGRE